ncbi:hypothetical protein CQY22_004340 [Mycolicibacterium brumae]|uniref:DUF732 domain-containing protein n=1 Tax=Mycolicibacterium brumae TaxID=85968 RepID=A0A2G5PEY4_9MYCO|nr:hypothetical protein CQY22_004340 [Mycolicibacterium brumae]RWA20580.1 hypothetical protein MBRU_02670 [Mycolicibacterium brumae DSM 44177]
MGAVNAHHRIACAFGALSVGVSAWVLGAPAAVAAPAPLPAGYTDNEHGGVDGQGWDNDSPTAPEVRSHKGDSDFDARTTQNLVRHGLFSHPGDMALPHTKGSTEAGVICKDGACP